MKGFSPISRAYRRLVRKHRLTLQNEVDNAEEWHMHISVVRIFAALLAFVLLLFILILSLVAYTPVLEFLPGYEANRSREMLLQNIMRLDSIERQMTQMRTYSDNIALIMEGKTPVVRNVGGLDSIKADKTLVMPSREDSLLRIQMEGEGPYGLGKSPSRKTLREAMAMTAPVEGIITEKFDTKLGQYGIRIAAAPGSQVSAAEPVEPRRGLRGAGAARRQRTLDLQKSRAVDGLDGPAAPQRRGAGIQQRPAGRRHRLETLRLRTVERRQARRSRRLHRILMEHSAGKAPRMKQRIALLGSTGSIGVQTLDIVRENSELFEITTLTAHRNWEALARQAEEFAPDSVVIADDSKYDALRRALADRPVKVYAGADAIRQVVQADTVDTVVNALVGYAGLLPTVAAIEAGKKVALANKETLVVGGDYVMRLAAERRVPILPIDSEHSAIFQCLVGEASPARRLIVTCSGGALRDVPRERLAEVTVEQALRHPQWRMGAKITIDSATLVNKGFEVIEARWLFGMPAERISVLIHPQSVVHSMVEFEDGAIKAQLGTPDMHLPIGFALLFPRRAARAAEQFSFADNPTLTFAEPDRQKYPALDMAYDCLHDERRQRSGRRRVPGQTVRLPRHRAHDRTCTRRSDLRRAADARRLRRIGRRGAPHRTRISENLTHR